MAIPEKMVLEDGLLELDPRFRVARSASIIHSGLAANAVLIFDEGSPAANEGLGSTAVAVVIAIAIGK